MYGTRTCTSQLNFIRHVRHSGITFGQKHSMSFWSWLKISNCQNCFNKTRKLELEQDEKTKSTLSDPMPTLQIHPMLFLRFIKVILVPYNKI